MQVTRNLGSQLGQGILVGAAQEQLTMSPQVLILQETAACCDLVKTFSRNTDENTMGQLLGKQLAALC